MSSTKSVPQKSRVLVSHVMPTLQLPVLNSDSDAEDADCDLCSGPLLQTIEQNNRICSGCMQSAQREAKLDKIDDLVSAAMGVLHMAPLVAYDIRPDRARAWEGTVERMRKALMRMQCL